MLDCGSWAGVFSNVINSGWWATNICAQPWKLPFETNVATIHPAVTSFSACVYASSSVQDSGYDVLWKTNGTTPVVYFDPTQPITLDYDTYFPEVRGVLVGELGTSDRTFWGDPWGITYGEPAWYISALGISGINNIFWRTPPGSESADLPVSLYPYKATAGRPPLPESLGVLTIREGIATNVTPEWTNWTARIPYVTTNVYSDLAKGLTAMSAWTDRAIVVGFTNYMYSGQSGGSSFADAKSNAWANLLADIQSGSCTTSTSEGASLGYNNGDRLIFRDYMSVYGYVRYDLFLFTTILEFNTSASSVRANSNPRVYVVINPVSPGEGFYPVTMPQEWDDDVPRLVPTNRVSLTSDPASGHLQVVMQAEWLDMAAITNNLPVRFGENIGPYEQSYGWEIHSEAPVGVRYWDSILVLKPDFLHLTNTATFWP
jgi:hypothetical protein